MDTSQNPAFVFIHGAWHNHHTWDKVIAGLAERGYASVAIDLPGAGVNAARPASFEQRPLDAAAFASEPSPNAGVSQAQRNEAAIAAVKEAAAKGNGKVVLVGHSLGGLTVNQLGEQLSDSLHAVVYLAAMMLPNGLTAGEFIGGDDMARSHVLSLLLADPEAVGALRIDTASDDPEYVAGVKQAFYGDVAESVFREILKGLHPDEPALVSVEPSPVTRDNYGRLPRHYIRLTEDLAVPIEAQDALIRLVDEQLGNATQIHTLAASHSPFLSMPDELVDILVSTAV